ncbi:MAG: aminotransferase class I/II-fold pyridoxal phosphate-dependent enzyme [Bacillota bacterium]|nr:aminotransferase class I/II-fold pyridoxal phosphate-dependent enzyme [Bacillota bacterium]
MNYLDMMLEQYSRTNFYPFHMPGHKRQVHTEYLNNPYAVDITEITDFDNLHHAEGIIKENQDMAAELYHADRTWFLINGSTAGILAAVSACTSRGGKLLMARNCHKAVYHAAYLRGLETSYVYPSYEPTCGLNGKISPDDVEKALQEKVGVEAVIITSPSYDGVVSDIERIAKIVHSYGIPLVVDEAHGAHFAFSECFPISALDLGADVVIHSLHKTLPAMTQTALLHKRGNRVSSEKLEEFLGIYETSSPSYILMGGISYCLRFLREQGKEKFRVFRENLEWVREQLKTMKTLHLVGEELIEQKDAFNLDFSKIVISTENADINGPQLHKILREKYHLELEMEAEQYVLALTSVMDSREGFERLANALLQIDKTLKSREERKKTFIFKDSGCTVDIRQKCTIWEAVEGDWEVVPLQESRGRTSAEYAYLYPPGIPFLVPGEEISEKFLNQAERLKKQGMYFQGLKDYSQKKIRVLKER